jgi:hypothetical protein
MGMDLLAKNGEASRYNWQGWSWFVDFVKQHGVNTADFSWTNDGAKIPEEVCKEVAKAIRDGSVEYNYAFAGESYGLAPAEEHAKFWENSGGVEQW